MQKRITTAHLILIVTFELYLIFQWCFQNLPVSVHPVVQIVVGQLVLVLPGIGWMRLKKVDFQEDLGFRPVPNESLKMAVFVLVCAYPSIVVLNMISMIFVKNAVASVIPEVMRLGFWPSIGIMALMPALNEEFLCRSLLYQAYRPVSKIGGALLSALIFGLLHLNFNQMPYAFFVGIIFALMVEATGSVYTSMVMHFLLNGFNVGMNYYAMSMRPGAADQMQTAAAVSPSPDHFVKNLLVMLVIMGISILATGLLIMKTFMMNGRTMRYYHMLPKGKKQGTIVDVWILFFIGFALILTCLNTVFL